MMAAPYFRRGPRRTRAPTTGAAPIRSSNPPGDRADGGKEQEAPDIGRNWKLLVVGRLPLSTAVAREGDEGPARKKDHGCPVAETTPS